MVKECSKCKEIKDLDQFGKRGHSIKSWCKSCCSTYNPNWTKDNLSKIRENRLQFKHGVGLELYNSKLLEQNSKCAICNSSSSRKANSGTTRSLCVDHCHKTGKISGLLCHNCNIALGLLNDSLKNVLNMAEYIKKYGGS